MIESTFDIAFIADLALHEKQIQQNYRPIIAVHKWFARRPGTLFRGLLLSEFVAGSLSESFYQANDLSGLCVADLFMGGGTPLLEANRLGCDVIGYDINPVACWIVKEEIEHLDLPKYRAASQALLQSLEKAIGHLYRTTCLKCGSDAAHVKYFLWVKTKRCSECGKEVDLFPGYVVAKKGRHTANVLLCAECGQLNEREALASPGTCDTCSRPLVLAGPARANRCPCPHCGHPNVYPDRQAGAPQHRLFAIEYHCPRCKPGHTGRFFKAPDEADLARVAEATRTIDGMQVEFVPDDEIPAGDETDRLHRWGYTHYKEMFGPRQLLGLELSCKLIGGVQDQRVRNALATNLSDLLRYQNMLCRYDTAVLKSLDIFSVHGFPVGLVQCESNLLGISNGGGASVGSGGWSNIVSKFDKAKSFCDAPFEIRHVGTRKVTVPIPGEWIGDARNGGHAPGRRNVTLLCEDAAQAQLPKGKLDAVLTDPPYFGNVQYAELMDFCYVWLCRLAGASFKPFASPTTRNANELTGNENMGRGVEHFADGLSRAFQNAAQALKKGAPLVFTYHHNDIDAYYPIAVAVLDAGLACTASLPCPGEMSASIHISGTCSSIIDTVFVCRATGRMPRKSIASSPAEVARLIRADVEELRKGGVNPSPGDIRCVVCGHLTRLAIWNLRKGWDKERPVQERLRIVRDAVDSFGGVNAVQGELQPVESI